MIHSKTLILTSTYPEDLSPTSNSDRRRLRQRFVRGLHGVSLLASLISISLFAAAIPRWNANFFHSTGPNRGDWTDGMPIAPLLMAFLFHAAILLRAGFWKLRNTVAAELRPQSHLSLILQLTIPTLVLLSLFPSLVLASVGGLFRFWQPAVHSQSGILVCNMLNIFTKDCQPELYHIGSLQISAITFGIIVWMVHFALLLVGLRSWKRSRMARQLQQEKIARYASNESRGSQHGRRRGFSVHRPTTEAERGKSGRDKFRRFGSELTSAAHLPLSRSQTVPIVSIQPPEQSHLSTLQRHQDV